MSDSNFLPNSQSHLKSQQNLTKKTPIQQDHMDQGESLHTQMKKQAQIQLDQNSLDNHSQQYQSQSKQTVIAKSVKKQIQDFSEDSFEHQAQQAIQQMKKSAKSQSSVYEWEHFMQYAIFFLPIINLLSPNQRYINSTIQRLNKKCFERANSAGFTFQKIEKVQDRPFTIQRNVRNTSKNQMIIQVICTLGMNSKTYAILNINTPSPNHSKCLLVGGNMGRIYTDSHASNTVFKCTCLRNQDSKASLSVMENFFNEFIIADLTSTAQAGPKIHKTNGFDAIFYDGCIEFCMQKCTTHVSESFEHNLKESLFIMHGMRIVHNDIKPENVMYSPFYQKNVFIDFGISNILSKTIGCKTLTVFKGTYNYCGQEMRAAFQKQRQFFVDFYKNDLDGLASTLQKIRGQQNIKQHKINQSNRQKNKDSSEIEQDPNFNGQIQEIISSELITKLKNELLMKLQYFAYTFQHKNQANEQFRQCIMQTYLLLDEQNRIILENEISQFIHNQVSNEQNCFKLIIKESTSLDTPLLKDYLEMNSILALGELAQKKPQESNDSKSSLSKFSIRRKLIEPSFNETFFLLNQKIKINIEQITSNKLEEILMDSKRCQTCEIQELFTYFLEYASFWENKHHVDIQSKLLASMRVCEYLKRNKIDIKSEYISEKYYTIEPQIRQCYCFVSVAFSCILKYCMVGQPNQFKLKYLMLVVKDCILLNFAAYHFVEKAVSRYIQMLIKLSVIPAVTLTLINLLEICWLISNHFILIKSDITQIISELTGKPKTSIFSFEQFFTYLNLITIHSEQERTTLKIIRQMICWLIPIHFRFLLRKQIKLNVFNGQIFLFHIEDNRSQRQSNTTYDFSLNTVVQQIQKEFKAHTDHIVHEIDKKKYLSSNLLSENKFQIQIYKKAVHLVISQARRYDSREKHLPKGALNPYVSLNDQIKENSIFRIYMNRKSQSGGFGLNFYHDVESIDQMIDCSCVSRYLMIDSRLKYYILKFDNKNFFDIVKIIAYNRWASIQIWPSLARAYMSFQILTFGFFSDKDPKAYHQSIMSGFEEVIILNTIQNMKASIYEGNYLDFKNFIVDWSDSFAKSEKQHIDIDKVRYAFLELAILVESNMQRIYKMTQKTLQSYINKKFPISKQSFEIQVKIDFLLVDLQLQKQQTPSYYELVKQILSLYLQLYNHPEPFIKIISKRQPSSIGFQYGISLFWCEILFIKGMAYYYGDLNKKGFQNTMIAFHKFGYSIQLQSQNHQFLDQFIHSIVSSNYQQLTDICLIHLSRMMQQKFHNPQLKEVRKCLRISMNYVPSQFSQFLNFFFSSVENPFGTSSKNKLQLGLFYTNVLSFESYFRQNPFIWQKCLYVVFSNLKIYPKFINEGKRIQKQRELQANFLAFKYLKHQGRNKKAKYFMKRFIRDFDPTFEEYYYSKEDAISIVKTFTTQQIIAEKVNSSTQIKVKKSFQYCLKKYLRNCSLNQNKQQFQMIKDINQHELSDLWTTNNDVLYETGIKISYFLIDLEKRFKDIYGINQLYPLFHLNMIQIQSAYKSFTGLEEESQMSQNMRGKTYNLSEHLKIKHADFAGLGYYQQLYYFLYEIFEENKDSEMFTQEVQMFAGLMKKIKSSQIHKYCQQISEIVHKIIDKQKKLLELSKISI